jgi:hypothetical protein
VKNRSEKWGAPVLDAPEGRRDEFVEPYFRQCETRSVGRRPEGTRTCPHSHRHRLQRQFVLSRLPGLRCESKDLALLKGAARRPF